MFETDRIITEPCGCHVDREKGLRISFNPRCRLKHGPRPTSPGNTPWADLTLEVKIALVQAMIPYLSPSDLDAIYSQHSYLVEMPGSPVKRKVIV